MLKMATVLLCLTIVLIVNGFTYGKLDNIPKIYVDKSGKSSSFSTIQAAIDAVPSNNKNWICISVTHGVYEEIVKIPQEKPFIYLKGEGMDTTRVKGDRHGGIFENATFISLADNILVSGITFENSYNYPPSTNRNPVTQALAAQISGDKSAFYKCGFVGYQDTLFDATGKHYFSQCNVEGAVDFIFGNGQSIYENCTISMNRGKDLTGYIAAQARDNPDQTSGFVFKHCTIDGMGKAYLGRAYRNFSRVIYFESDLSDVVVPQGWDIWNAIEHKQDVTFVEEGCEGAGSKKNTPNRVPWVKTLTPRELKSFTSISYIDSDGWIQKLPIDVNVYSKYEIDSVHDEH